MSQSESFTSSKSLYGTRPLYLDGNGHMTKQYPNLNVPMILKDASFNRCLHISKNTNYDSCALACIIILAIEFFPLGLFALCTLDSAKNFICNECGHCQRQNHKPLYVTFGILQFIFIALLIVIILVIYYLIMYHAVLITGDFFGYVFGYLVPTAVLEETIKSNTTTLATSFINY